MKNRKRANNFVWFTKSNKVIPLSESGNQNHIKFTCNLLVVFFYLIIITPSFAYSGIIKGRVHIVGGLTDGNAVVYIDKVNKKFAPPDTPAVMDQKDLMFKPEVLPILAGTTVKFVNSDVVLHDVLSPTPCGGEFDLGLFPGGQSRTHVFKHAGCAAIILCDVHPEMQAWVVVLQNPYYAVTKSDGEYIIRNVPAGTYTLKAWYNYYRVESVKVTVPESGEVEVNFQLKP